MKMKALAVVAAIAMAFAFVAIADDTSDAVAADHSKYIFDYTAPAEGAAAPTFAIAFTPDQEYTGYNITSTVETVVANADGANLTAIPVLGLGATTITVTCLTSNTEDVDPTFQVYLYVYSAEPAKVIGYAKDATTGLQGIVYSDGTAVIQFTSAPAGHVSIDVNGAEFPGMIGLGDDNRLNLQLRGIIDTTAITDDSAETNVVIAASSPYTTQSADLGTLRFAPYNITLNANGGSFTALEEEGEEPAPVANVVIATNGVGAINLGKGLTLETILYTDAEQAEDDVTLFAAISPRNDPLAFVGFADAQTAAASHALLPIADDMTIENFIFGLVTVLAGEEGSQVQTAYAIWDQVVYQIYISDGAATPELAQGQQTVGDYTVNAPSVAVYNDIIMVKIVGPNVDARYTLQFYEYSDYTNTTEGHTPTALTLQTRMLTNSIIAVTGVEQNLVIVVTATQTANAVFGYQFGMVSVENDSDVGTAVAQLTLFDYAPANAQNITMSGTYYINDGILVFGSIQNLIAQGQLVYNLVLDGVPQQTTTGEGDEAETVANAYGEAGIEVTADHSNYVVSLVNVTSEAEDEVDYGFYAVKGSFNGQDSNYMLM